MIRKKVFLILILIITVSTYVFANTIIEEENKDSIISLSSLQVTVGSEFYLTLNLTNIPFSKFKVDIVNTASLPMDELTSEVASLSTNDVATTFIVEKSLINLDKLGIIFTAPEEVSKVKFETTITSLDVTVETLKEDLEIKNLELIEHENQLKKLEEQIDNNKVEEIESTTETIDLTLLEEEIIKLKGLISSIKTEITELENEIIEFEAETLKAELIVDVIEIKNIMDKEDVDKAEIEKEFEKEFEKEMEKNKKEMNEMNNKMNDLQKNLDNAESTISSLTKNVTYQGSQNNYLKSLSLTGYEFDSNFKKTTDTYFTTVDKDTQKVTVNATAEDSSAIVTIYGNTNLQEGKNKVLITITADDGSVRNYKIYITK